MAIEMDLLKKKTGWLGRNWTMPVSVLAMLGQSLWLCQNSYRTWELTYTLKTVIFHSCVSIWRFPRLGVRQNAWFILEYPIKRDDLGWFNGRYPYRKWPSRNSWFTPLKWWCSMVYCMFTRRYSRLEDLEARYLQLVSNWGFESRLYIWDNPMKKGDHN